MNALYINIIPQATYAPLLDTALWFTDDLLRAALEDSYAATVVSY